MVDHPSHVKKLTMDQLHALSDEIRHELITKLSKNGGHLGPNLGVVELTVEQTLPVQVEGVLQVDLLDGGVGRAADTDHVERVAVQVEGMAQVGLLDCGQSGRCELV